MAELLHCAQCGPPVLAQVLVIHPHLFRMVIPACALCGVLAGDAVPLNVVPLDSPEGRDVLETHTLLRGFVIPR
jgi:hypothetical protein